MRNTAYLGGEKESLEEATPRHFEKFLRMETFLALLLMLSIMAWLVVS